MSADKSAHETVEPIEADEPRSRRSLLAAAAAASAALAAQALLRPAPASAADVVLGAVNTAPTATTIRTLEKTPSAKALIGLVVDTGPGNSTAGVQGQSNAANGNGIFGVAMAGNSKGVWGRSANGRGVYGEAIGAIGLNYGVHGDAKGNYGIGVYGTGVSCGVSGKGVATGVIGNGINYGVHGTGETAGVYGGGTTHGVYGIANAFGVSGVSTNKTAFGAGVYGKGNSYAGFFDGDVWVNGTVIGGTSRLLIDHPQDPANKTLAHSTVEAPEMLNIYRGTATLDSRGTAVVRLPRYYEAFNRDHHVQLTAIGAPAPSLHVAREVVHGGFRIGGGAVGQKVYWIVTGVRQDAWAQEHPLRVEHTKRRKDRGKYLNPEVFGKPVSARLHQVPEPARIPRQLQRREGT